jgi:D-glycero-D-manno-heptose 1,7-bisphosphate phosphatase
MLYPLIVCECLSYTFNMKAVFLDRDGTLIVDPPDLRVDSIEEIELFPDTIEAMRQLAKLDYGVVLVTNQAGIAEGRLTEDDFWQIENKVIEMLAPSGIKILKTYFCPHSPADNCQCRKPKPFMLLQAAKDLDIDLANSYTIGDRESDILAGQSAGTKTILVQTGNTPVTSTEATYTAANLLEAVRYITTH